MRKILLFLFAAGLTLTAFAAGEKIADISHEELKAAIAAGKVTLIDANNSDMYADGHIPGAMSYAAVKKDFAARLPKDKDALIVAYCGGPGCPLYQQPAKAAIALGYTNVKHYSRGISGWEAKGEPTEK